MKLFLGILIFCLVGLGVVVVLALALMAQGQPALISFLISAGTIGAGALLAGLLLLASKLTSDD